MMESVPERLELAIRHHQSGELDLAGRLYQDIIDTDPDHADALHLLGITAHQRNKNQAAVGYIRRAIDINDSAAIYHSNLGAAYQALGDVEEAVECFREAIRIAPTCAEAWYNLAAVLQGANRREEACDAYRIVLQHDPGNVRIHDTLGSLLKELGRYEESIEAYQRAICLEPNQSVIHNNLGTAFQALEAHQRSIASFRRALALSPENPAIRCNLAMALLGQGNADEAVDLFFDVIRAAPGHASAYLGLANALSSQAKHAEAVEQYGCAIRLQSEMAEAHFGLGICQRHLGNLDLAVQSFEATLCLRPEHAKAYNNLGNLRQDRGDTDGAINCYRRALEIDPNDAAAHNNLGTALKESNQYEAAAGSLQRAITLAPDSADAYFNLGNLHRDQDQLAEAIDCYQQSLSLQPGHIEARVNQAVALKDQRRLDEALAGYDEIIGENPELAEAHFNRALIRLLREDFAHGWDEYEWRWKQNSEPKRYSYPEWDGSCGEEKTLLVYAEQGIGDEIMFSSCLPDLIERNVHCLVECDRRLLPLFSRSFPRATFFAKQSHEINTSFSQSIDAQIPIGSLPRLFRRHFPDFPHRRSYLKAETNRRAFWESRLGECGSGLKIGISWFGGKEAEANRKRSTTLTQWQPLLKQPGVQFINLQYGDVAEALARTKQRCGLTIHDWDESDPLRNLDEFAALISALDLVISVDNSTVHLAGALGTPVWTLLPFASDWRWLLSREETPWYPSVRLFRQHQFGDWDELFSRVAQQFTSLIEVNYRGD